MNNVNESREIYRGGTLVVWTKYTDDGRIAVEGQDLGGHPACDEYEYFIWINPEEFPAFRAALGAAPDVDALELMTIAGPYLVEAGETKWLKEHGISYQFENWMH